MESKGFRILLLRGVLGGAVGGFTMAALSVLVQLEHLETNWGQWLLVFFLFLGLPYGLFVGGLVGVTIWLIHYQTKVNVGPLMRAIIGTSVGVATAGVLHLMTDRTGYVPTSLRSQLVDAVMFGITIGGLPGLFVGRQIFKGPYAFTKERE